jgi:hypothetical protein
MPASGTKTGSQPTVSSVNAKPFDPALHHPGAFAVERHIRGKWVVESALDGKVDFALGCGYFPSCSLPTVSV